MGHFEHKFQGEGVRVFVFVWVLNCFDSVIKLHWGLETETFGLGSRETWEKWTLSASVSRDLGLTMEKAVIILMQCGHWLHSVENTTNLQLCSIQILYAMLSVEICL